MKPDLIIDMDFVSTWHPRYDEIESDEPEYQRLVKVVGEDFETFATLRKTTFISILDWKAARVKGKVKFDQWPHYEAEIARAIQVDDPSKLGILIGLYGIGVPVGSTILHFMYPDRFPIIDVRTTETLYQAGCISSACKGTVAYPTFCAAIQRIASAVAPFSLREIDRALFAYHKIHLDSQKTQCHRCSSPPKRSAKIGVPMATGNQQKVLEVFKSRSDRRMTRDQIIDLVVDSFPGTPRGSVIPSDYCYNMVNRDSSSFQIQLFECIGRGTYKCLGANYPYSGPIYWKGKKVGQWKDGKYDLWQDPRK